MLISNIILFFFFTLAGFGLISSSYVFVHRIFMIVHFVLGSIAVFAAIFSISVSVLGIEPYSIIIIARKVYVLFMAMITSSYANMLAEERTYVFKRFWWAEKWSFRVWWVNKRHWLATMTMSNFATIILILIIWVNTPPFLRFFFSIAAPPAPFGFLIFFFTSDTIMKNNFICIYFKKLEKKSFAVY